MERDIAESYLLRPINGLEKVMKNDKVLVSGAVIFKEYRGKQTWLVVKRSEENGWEIPKTVVRKGESSVKAAIRMMGEQGDMAAQVLEEAGRAGGSISINGKVVPQKNIYYLMMQRSTGEILGFEKHKWLEYSKAARRLGSKREQSMLKQAKKELRKWKKEQEAKIN